MDSGLFSTTGNRRLGTVLLLMAVLGLASWIVLNLAQADQAVTPATITVEGMGEAVAIPDIATFSFSVEAEGDTADAAQTDSAEKMNSILSYLGEAGIAETDIKTTNYNLYPKYRYEERICTGLGYCPPGEQIQDGFTASQMVEVKVRETEEAGKLIAGVGQRGATNISGLQFIVDDLEAVKIQAREQAITDARAKAEVLADNLGVRITGLAGYNEDSSDYDYPESRYMTMEAQAMDEMVAPKLPTGEQETKVTVSITYEVK